MPALTRREWLKMMSLLFLMLSFGACKPSGKGTSPTPDVENISLPQPKYDSPFSLENAILQRRSMRSYTQEALSLADVSQLLWAAQGITNSSGKRAAPSAGATYPLEVYVVAGDVKGLPRGMYHYDNQAHGLSKLVDGDQRQVLAEAALNQAWVADAAINIVISAVYERTTGYYGNRGIRYTDMEAGHAAQNIYLQAVALGLGTVAVGAFDDSQVSRLLSLPSNERPLYIMPVGRLS